MIRGFVFLAFLGIAFASLSANKYIENVIKTTLPNELRGLGLDPAPIPNFSVPFGTQTVNQCQGEATFTFGNITGFAGVKRQSECSRPKLYRGELTINCTLSFYPLTTNYKVMVRNGSTVSYPRSVGHVSETLVHVVISGKPENYVGFVKSFQVTRLGQINPTFSGLAPAFNQYVKVLQDGYRANVSTNLYNAVQQRFVYALSRALAYKPMPRQ